MLRALSLAGAFTALLATAPAPAAAGTASFLVVHGIPGRDVAPTLDPLLPVDVLVNGKICLLSGLTFGTIAGPFDVPSGTYTVAVSLANPIAPCSNSAVVSGSVTLSDGEFGAAVAQLSTGGAPALGVYAVDVSSVTSGDQRFVTVHAADAPPVVVKVVSTGKTQEKAKFDLKPGQENTTNAKLAPGWDVSVTVKGGGTLGPIPLSGGPAALFLSIAVGSAASGSLTVLEKTIPSVF